MNRLTLLCALALIPLTAAAQTWPALAYLKPGTHIQADSVGSASYGLSGERCRFITVDASTLACASNADPRTRLIFPVQQVEAVYQIKRPLPSIGAILGLAVAGTFIGGLVTLCPPAIAVGFIGGVIALGIAQFQAQERFQQAIWGFPPPPPPPSERLKIVYHR